MKWQCQGFEKSLWEFDFFFSILSYSVFLSFFLFLFIYDHRKGENFCSHYICTSKSLIEIYILMVIIIVIIDKKNCSRFGYFYKVWVIVNYFFMKMILFGECRCAWYFYLLYVKKAPIPFSYKLFFYIQTPDLVEVKTSWNSAKREYGYLLDINSWCKLS